jgi:6-phosphogluconate dehydrogenase
MPSPKLISVFAKNGDSVLIKTSTSLEELVKVLKQERLLVLKIDENGDLSLTEITARLEMEGLMFDGQKTRVAEKFTRNVSQVPSGA